MVPKSPYMIHDCPDILWYCPYMLLCSYLPILLPSLFQCHTIIFQLSIVRMKLWLHFLVIVIVANYIVDDLLYMYFQLYLSEVSKFELHLCYVDIVKQKQSAKESKLAICEHEQNINSNLYETFLCHN